MSYFPIDVINSLQQYSVLDDLIPQFIDVIKEETGEDIKIEDDFLDFIFSQNFFNPLYDGKYAVINNYLMYNKPLNQLMHQGIHFNDFHQRKTEWRDLFGECYILKEWSQSKMVYKVDGSFFHTIKNTKNLKFSNNMLSHLPFNTMYFDLSDVKDIGNFAGAWVQIRNYAPREYMSTIYMVTRTVSKASYNGNTVDQHGLFSYYCAYNFSELKDDEEIDVPISDMLNKIQDDYILRDFQIDNGEIKVTKQPLKQEDDHRREIIAAILQILEFLHAKIDDIEESPITKSTYKPSTVVKNKFSEVRQWDVGIRYGKAIRFAQKQVAEEAKRMVKENNSLPTKTRKPVRPHIRSAHWQRYHVGEGRKEIKVNWIPPIYVCGTKEIPVTIRKVGA